MGDPTESAGEFPALGHEDAEPFQPLARLRIAQPAHVHVVIHAVNDGPSAPFGRGLRHRNIRPRIGRALPDHPHPAAVVARQFKRVGVGHAAFQFDRVGRPLRPQFKHSVNEAIGSRHRFRPLGTPRDARKSPIGPELGPDFRLVVANQPLPHNARHRLAATIPSPVKTKAKPPRPPRSHKQPLSLSSPSPVATTPQPAPPPVRFARCQRKIRRSPVKRSADKNSHGRSNCIF